MVVEVEAVEAAEVAEEEEEPTTRARACTTARNAALPTSLVLRIWIVVLVSFVFCSFMLCLGWGWVELPSLGIGPAKD